MGVGKPWRQGWSHCVCRQEVDRDAGDQLAFSPPHPFIEFVLDPSRGMVPPTSRGFPPPLIFPATALTDILGCFLGDSKPRHVDSEDILLLPTCEDQKYR